MKINGILVLFHQHLVANAATINESISAFSQYSRFPVWSVNTELGFPPELHKLEFSVIILHYSLFGISRYLLDRKFITYLKASAAYKIVFFQDEHHYCRQRFAFIDRFRINCVYSLVDPAYFKDTYQKYTRVPKLVYYIPGYVSETLIKQTEQTYLPDDARTIDVGYRGRNLLSYFYMGRGAREKSEIAIEFRRHAEVLGLKLDIEFEENKRIYGLAWYSFLANCRAVLGVEAGVSIFDVEDTVRTECERLLYANPKMTFEEMTSEFLSQWEGNIPYRTISPRHFEAAALRTCQILYEGAYSGIMRPMVHYIPLKKDWSNFNQIIQLFRNPEVRRQLTENAYRDLIGSGKYTYQEFITEFDEELCRIGLQLGIDPIQKQSVDELLKVGSFRGQVRGRIKALRVLSFPGRSMVLVVYRTVRKRYRRLRARESMRAMPYSERQK